jgi:FkbM family methyltransferase
MRIVIDLQGAQTTDSRFRGIGRYSLALAQAMARRPRGHEIWVALNGLFVETLEPLRAAFDGLIPRERIVAWEAPKRVCEGDPGSRWRREAGERLREAVLARLAPDMVHVSSMFEGFTSDALTSIGTLGDSLPTAVTLYDLIPLIQRGIYLTDATVESWYERKLDMLRRSDLWLAISESSRREGIEHLGLPADRVINVSTAADSMFRPIELNAPEAELVRRRYGITHGFLMYTGGIDHRKNLEGLIRAYARLPIDTRSRHQLVVVCSATVAQKATLHRQGSAAGLAEGELVVTGFIPDADMVALYNLCSAFAFPSWHEGFGLPALEAMSCGAAVVAANTSSLPEVIGNAEALFDPHDERSITERLHAVLTDEAWRKRLKSLGLAQSRNFSWEASAARALDAFERIRSEKSRARSFGEAAPPQRRPRLAYLSPLPPQASGIADYSAELLPELSRHYEIDVVVSDPAAIGDRWRRGFNIRSVHWFDDNAGLYERVLYHFGNSSFHQHMFDLLERHPGTVVLHDFFLSGAVAHADATGHAPGLWVDALYRSHGYAAVLHRHRTANDAEILWKYPANLAVLQRANGIIVHSEFSRSLASRWYGVDVTERWALIPHLRQPVATPDRAAARVSLGVDERTFLVCSFGMIGPTKLNHRLLADWLASPLARDPHCRLVFVGENCGGEYGEQLLRTIEGSSCSAGIAITGYAAPELYRSYLAAADAAVQLRVQSRGETSGTILDCMNHGVATIVNAHGAVAEIASDDSCLGLADDFSPSELTAALIRLRGDPAFRRALGENGRRRIRRQHQPRLVADQYREAIERYAVEGPRVPSARVIDAIARIEPGPADNADWTAAAKAVARNHPPRPRQRELLVDIGMVPGNAGRGVGGSDRIVAGLLTELRSDSRIEPVYVDPAGVLRYARRHALQLLGCPVHWLDDEPVDTFAGDVYIGELPDAESLARRGAILRELRNQGVRVHFLLKEVDLERSVTETAAGEPDARESPLLYAIDCADGMLCTSIPLMDGLLRWLEVASPPRLRALSLGVWDPSFERPESQVRTALAEDARSSEFVAAALGQRFSRQWSAGQDDIGTAERPGASGDCLTGNASWNKGNAMNGYEFFPLTLPDGRTIELALPSESTDPVVNAYKSGQALNQYLIDLLLRFTRAGERVLDLGCHVGTLSVPAACLGRTVVAVDASRLHAGAVEASARRNGLASLDVICCAVDATEGEVEFSENGLWGMVAQGAKASTGTQRIAARRADAIAADAGWSRVDLVKMDVEGSELAAIESLGTLLDGDAAPVLIYESNGMTFEIFGYTIRELRKRLEALHYRTYRVEGPRLVYCHPGELQPEAWLDLVALPPAWQRRLAGEIDSTWAPEAMVQRCLMWGTNEHRNVREYLAQAMGSDATYPRDDARIVELRTGLAREFGAACRQP